MDSSALEPGTASINGGSPISIPGAKLDCQSLEIHLLGRAGIGLYVFKSSMFPNEAKREGVEHYKFAGPKLGMYHDTVDPREGPYVNHFIDQLEIFISYPSRDEAQLVIKGSSDLTKSSIDPYWYKGATSGSWTFEVSFTHRFRKP